VQQDRLLRSHIVTQLALLVANACHDIHQGNHLRAMATYELDVRLDVYTQLIRYSGLCFYFRYHKIRTGNVDVGENLLYQRFCLLNRKPNRWQK